MSAYFAIRLAARMMRSFALAGVLVMAAGCSKKAVKETPSAAGVTAMEPAVPATPPAVAETPSAEVSQPAEPMALDNVHFDYDKFDLKPAMRDLLYQHAQTLKLRPEVNVVIEGHCDERGTIEYNLALGERRAQTVLNYLATLGVERARMKTISYGKERPLVYGHNEAAWAQNRRAQFVVEMPSVLSERN